ncbi:MAG: HAD family hydrolase, partial [Bacteroidaceae bacterium]|nr:HAD family hydrolase [Bacteroidaceae bacterium]
RSHASLAQYVESLELSSLISYILGADDVKEGKPNPEPVNKILGIFRFKAEETLVVGDTAFDIQMGKSSGTMTCGVTYGNGSKESLADADWVIDDFSELLELTE